MTACTGKGKTAYEAATGKTIDAKKYKEKQTKAATKDMNRDLNNCNKIALKIADAGAKAAKIEACDTDAKTQLIQGLGMVANDLKAGSVAKKEFDRKYINYKKTEAKTRASEAIRNSKDLSKEKRTAVAKTAMLNSMGKADATADEVEKYIVDGATLASGETMDTCMDGVDTTLTGNAKKAAFDGCNDESKEIFIASRMMEGVAGIVDVEEKKVKEAEIEMIYKKAQDESAYKKSSASMKVYMATAMNGKSALQIKDEKKKPAYRNEVRK